MNYAKMIFGVALMAGLVLASPVKAQSADSGDKDKPAAAAPAGPAPRTLPGSGPASPSLNAMLAANGNSLTRAVTAAPAGADAATLNAVSYYAVAAPRPKTAKKHDIITIVIDEQSTFSSNGTTDLKKTSDLDAQLNSFVQLGTGMKLTGITPTVAPEVKGSTARDSHGEAVVDRTDQFTGRISAVVLDVKPNGNLVLQATKSIKTDDEQQEFILVGTCRVEDVTAANTVLSTQLADLSLTKNHSGAVRDTTKRGLLPRLLDFVNPF